MNHNQLQPLNLPRPVNVILDSHGHPVVVADAPHHSPSVQLRTPASEDEGDKEEQNERCTSVEAVIETWRVDDEWWREPISRRYVEVVLEGGRHIVLYEDLLTGNWFVQMA